MAAVPILRVIARMNVGGPRARSSSSRAGCASMATRRPWPPARRKVGKETYARAPKSWGIRVISIPGLASRVHPLRDARALAGLTSLMGRERPRIVHTHTAKAGALERAAARLAGVDARVHTFHGTVFESYFSKGASRWIVRAERRARQVGLADRRRLPRDRR